MNSNKTTPSGVFTFILFLSVLAAFLLAGCGTPLPERLAEAKAWEATCTTRPPAEMVDIDASGSLRRDGVNRDLDAIVRDAAARAATCRGHLLVRAFAGSSAGTVPLYDGNLSLSGATRQAQRLRLQGVEDHVSLEVSRNYRNISGLRDGSDIIGQARLASEYLDQIGSTYTLVLVIYTDGLQNVGQVDPTRATDIATAEKLVEQVEVPRLPGADITITGLGDRSGNKVSTATAEALTRFYALLCRRMAAARCRISTDYVSPVGR